MDSRVSAIRDDALVGHGSCTSIDECLTDNEIEELLDELSITENIEAIRWAREHEGLWLEQMLNARWGEDSDPELKTWNEWNKRLEDNPV